MANYIVSDVDLTLVADAIRAKGNTSDPLVFPGGFSDAITNISTSSGSSTTPKYTTATITPSESIQYATPPSGYDALSRVTVNPISSTYVGSGVAKKSSTDLTASGATVTVPAGYYASQSTKSVASGSAGTPSASKGTVSNHQVTITPTVTNTTGYITGGTKTGTGVTVSASELVSDNKPITSNGTNIDVTNYKTVSVNVPSSGTTINNQDKTVTPTESQKTVTADDGYTGLGTVTVNAISSTYVGSGVPKKASLDLTASGATVTVPAGYYASQVTKSVSTATLATPSASKGTVSNNQVSVTPSITQSSGYVTEATKSGTAVTVSASELVSGNKSITSNGTNIDVTNYKTVSVDVPTGGGGTDTSDATASASDIAKNKTAYVNGTKITGNVDTYALESGTFGGVFPNVNLATSRESSGDVYVDVVISRNTDALIRANTRLRTGILASEFGTATVEDVTAGKTFTGADGFNAIGTKEEPTYSETTGYIDRKQSNPPSSATSQTFTGMKGEPNWFVYTIAASSLPTASGYTRCVNIIYDGTNLVGTALGTSGTYSTSYFTKSYSGTSLTVGTTGSSTGGYVHNSSASEGYKLLYGYGGAHVNKTYTLNTGNSLSFTGINKKPDWFCLYVAQSFNASGDTVVDVVYDGKNVYGNYAASNSVKYATDFTYTYSGTTLTINSNSSSSFNVDDSGYDLIYGYANESEDSGSGDSGGGGSSSSDFYSGTFNGTGTKAAQVEINCGFQPTGFTIVSNTAMSAANNISMVSATKVGTTTYTGCVGYRGSYGSTITTSAFVNAAIPTSQVTVTFGTNSLTIKPGTNYAFQASEYTVHAWK